MLHRLILRYTLSIVTICSALSLHAENPHFYLKNNIQEITSIAEIKQWKHLGWKPSRVIFIDDKVSYLNSMGPPLASLGIEYIGIHYRGSEHVPATDLSEEAIKGSWQAIIAKAKLIADQR